MAVFAGIDLKKWRVSQDISAADLAERISCDVTTIYRYESGKLKPDPDTMYQICAELGDVDKWCDWMRTEYPASYGRVHPEMPSLSFEGTMMKMNVNLGESILSIIGCDADPVVEGDYLGDDGLMYCHICNTRKQVKLPFSKLGLPDRIVPCVCKCQQERIEEEERRRKAEEDQQAIDRLKSASLITQKYSCSTFDACKDNGYNSKAILLAKRYVDRFSVMFEKNQGLLFYGNPGTGKTYLAACIANALIQKKIPVMMTSFVKLISQMSNFGDDNEAIIRNLNRAKLLIIDDLGAERATEASIEKVYNIIDSRYRERKPMILTTNLTLGTMQQNPDIRYSRIYDRIFEICYPVEFTGPSWRCIEAADRFETMGSLFD